MLVKASVTQNGSDVPDVQQLLGDVAVFFVYSFKESKEGITRIGIGVSIVSMMMHFFRSGTRKWIDYMD